MKKDLKIKKQNKFTNYLSWPIKVFFLSLALSIFFSISSEFLLSGTGIIISILLIMFFILIAVLADMVGVAVTACPIEPFRSMASRKVRGAKEALILLKHADRVSSLCGDVIGDICGILSGAAGASIITKIFLNGDASPKQILLAAFISSVIAGSTIFFKALGKKYSMEKCSNITLTVGKFMSMFSKGEKKKKSNKEQGSQRHISDTEEL